MAIHSTFPKGSNIIIIFKNRKKLKTKYVEKKSGIIVTTDGEIKIKDISSTSFFKNRNTNQTDQTYEKESNNEKI